MALSACHHRCPFFHGIGNVALYLLDGICRNQRTLGHTVFYAIADLEALHLLCKFLDKGIVNGILDIDTVGADAGLAHISEL